MSYTIDFKRIYDTAEKKDGARVLVDRLWPRGKRRDELEFTEWYKDASPSAGLRRAWHKQEIADDTFEQDYRRELDANPDSLIPLMCYIRKGKLTLLTASHDPQHSHLPTLRAALLAALDEEDRQADGREPSSPTCYGL